MQFCFKILSLRLREAPETNFCPKLGIWPKEGEGGANPIPTFFFEIDQNLICLGAAHKCWDFVAIWRGFPSPNQQITKKMGLFHEKIIC